jgi:hypothetical protein
MEGFEGSAALIFDVADLPVLQDSSSQQAMSNWSASQRDFVILGGDNEEVDRYNLTMDSLDNAANRERVKAALISAAESID